jgi:hypothetical protein
MLLLLLGLDEKDREADWATVGTGEKLSNMVHGLEIMAR